MAVVGLTVSAGKLQLNGQRFRNIGMNWPGAIVRLYGQPSTTACYYNTSAEQDAGIALMQAMKVKVIRVLAFPLYPAQFTYGVFNGKAWNVATGTDRAIHYAYIDAFLAKCKAAGIGVILNFFWRLHTISDLASETARNFLSASNSRTLATTLIQEVVNRYATEEAVYGWEFSNELNHYNNFTGGTFPGVNTAYGTLASYSPSTSHCFYGTELASVISWFYGVIRAIDTQRIIISGNGPNRYYGAGGIGEIPYPMIPWVTEQVQDSPTNCGSYHWYGNIGYGADNFKGLDALLTLSKHFFKQANMGFLVGEFGNQPNKLQSITWESGTATLTIPSSSARAAFKSGDQILIGETGTSWDGNVLTIATIDSSRRLITANCPQYAENWTGSSGRFLDAGPRLQRTLDALYYADIDVGMMWMYDSDAYKPGFETVADHKFQQQMILNANTRLGW